MFNQTVRFIGSIKLAVPLLTAIVAILIGATFYESQVGSSTVQQEIYQSPWFGALMFLLAVNLGVSTMTRYPWRGAKKIGFALTHLGLIVIIAGSAAVIHLGMEGMLLVRSDSGANDRLRIEGDLLEVVSQDGELEQRSIFVKHDGSVSPRYVGDLELASYTENAVPQVNFTEEGTVANPGVRVSLASDRMGQTIERTLAAAPSNYSKVNLGPAELEIITADSKGELNRLLHPQQSQNHPWGEITITGASRERIFDVQNNLHKTLRLDRVKVKLTGFYPDFRLDRDRQPASASEEYRNPAVALEVTSGDSKERWYVFAQGDFPPVKTLVSGTAIADLTAGYQVEPPETSDYFRVIATAEQLYYTAKSSAQFKSGTLGVGQTITPGWADFEITLEDYYPHTQIKQTIVTDSNQQEQGSPALLVKTKSGQETWLLWGEANALENGDRQVLAAFSPKFFQLPFSVKLEDFIVDRNEGSQSVAMWTSKIRIEDPQYQVNEPRRVWMNHPTWYRGWKIAQASWNPGDLQQSTLQVKREPAWVTALTWTGSGLVILGIAVMFYAPSINRKLRQLRQLQLFPLQRSPSDFNL
ncbi:MAG: cytochrome c biogenesis protein ResB [Cyanobacteria bacterium J06621_8]